MRNLLFVFTFFISVMFVCTDMYRSKTECIYNCDNNNSVAERIKDTLKVVSDTAFKMNMSTNNPFRQRKCFYINLDEIKDTSYSYPLLDSKVISEYGSRNGRRHTGVDIKTFPNDSIYAVFSGVVVMSSSYYGYGNCIVLRHYNGLETLYSHNSKNLVRTGDYVKAGQVIALTGRTGRATTEHLHFECRVKGVNFNPNLIFDHPSERLRKGKLKFKNQRNGTDVVLIENKSL